MALISLEHVSKVYPKGTRPALDDINLDINRGDFVFLVGASGSGKTTLLSLLLREEEATDGEIRVAGNDLRRLSARQVPHYRRSIGFIFQDYKLLNNKTVWENVAFALEVIGTSRSTIKSLVPKVLQTVGLTGKEDSYPHELSGGMRKRVALAQTLIMDPDIILMDEPFSALDIQTRQLMENEVLALWSQKKKAVLFITHDLDEAISISDRVVVFSAGPGSHPIGEFYIDIARPRDVAEVRVTPRFIELHNAIWADLREEVLKGYENQRNRVK